jgi:hypothetical protein
MIRLRVVKDEYGWSVRIGEQMTSPFRRRDRAIREANRLAADIRRQGGQAEAVVEDVPGAPARPQPSDRRPGGRP